MHPTRFIVSLLCYASALAVAGRAHTEETRALLAAGALHGVASTHDHAHAQPPRSGCVGLLYNARMNVSQPAACSGSKSDDRIMLRCGGGPIGNGGAACPLHLDFLSVGSNGGGFLLSMLPGRSRADVGPDLYNRSITADVAAISAAGAVASICLLEGDDPASAGGAAASTAAGAANSSTAPPPGRSSRQEFSRYGVDANASASRPHLLSALAASGIKVYRFPVEDMRVMSESVRQKLKAALPELVKAVRDDGKRVHIFCESGHGRTGTLAAQLAFAINFESAVSALKNSTLAAVRAARNDTVETKEQEEDTVRVGASLGLHLAHLGA